jgi:hypothetical protein
VLDRFEVMRGMEVVRAQCARDHADAEVSLFSDEATDRSEVFARHDATERPMAPRQLALDVEPFARCAPCCFAAHSGAQSCSVDSFEHSAQTFDASPQ